MELRSINTSFWLIFYITLLYFIFFEDNKAWHTYICLLPAFTRLWNLFTHVHTYTHYLQWHVWRLDRTDHCYVTLFHHCLQTCPPWPTTPSNHWHTPVHRLHHSYCFCLHPTMLVWISLFIITLDLVHSLWSICSVPVCLWGYHTCILLLH